MTGGEPAPRPHPPRLLADTRPLREHPAFRRLWAGTLASSVGGWMTAFALTLQVYDLTHSAAAVGALSLAQGIPLLGLGLVGGSVTDGMDRRRLVLVTSSLLAVVSATLAGQAFASLRQLWLLYVLATVAGAVEALDAPARRTFLTRVLPAEQVPAGAALNQLAFQTASLAGPALAGLLVAAGGLRLAYLLDAISFGAALYAVARLPPVAPREQLRRPGLRATAEGLRYIRGNPLLAAAFLADLDATVLGMPRSLFPSLNAAHFGGGAVTLGLLTSAPAVGGLLGSTFSGPLLRVSRPGRAMLALIAVWGVTVAVFGVSTSLWLALLVLAVSGAADSASVVLRATLVQVLTPDRYRGRVTAADYVVGAGGPQLGNVEAGIVGSLTSPTVSAVSGGVGAVLGVAALHLAFPSFARYQAGRHPAD